MDGWMKRRPMDGWMDGWMDTTTYTHTNDFLSLSITDLRKHDNAELTLLLLYDRPTHLLSPSAPASSSPTVYSNVSKWLSM
jgi:hypothetical protein